MRLEPHAIARLGSRLQRGSAVISATNGKTTTAAMVAGILERAGAHLVHNRAGANMAGGVAAALMAGPPDGDTGLFEVDEFWLGQVVDELQPRALLLANLFRDQLDRYGELDSIADRWAAVVAGTSAALVLNADDPTVADLGRNVGATYFGVQDDAMALPQMQHAADAKHCRRCGAPYRYDAIYMGHLGPLPLRQLRRDAPRPAGLGPRHRARGGARRALHAAHAGRGADDRAAPARALQRLQRPRRGRSGPRAGSDARSGRRRPARGLPRLRARRDAADRRSRHVHPAGQEPGRRQRGPAHAHAGGRRARRPRRPQRQHRRRARRQLGVGRRLRGPRPPRAPRDVQWHPRGRDGAAAEVRRRPDRPDRRRARARGRPGPRPGRTATARSSPCPPTPRCSRCATCSSRAAPCTARSRDRRSSGTTSSAAATTSTCRCGASWPTARARRSSTSAPGPGASRSTSPAAATRWWRSTASAELLDALRRARRRPGREHRSRPTRATSTSVGASRSSSCRCRRCSCSAAPTGRARFLARAREHLAPGGLLAVALADALESFDEEHDQPPPPDLREVGGVVYASRPVSGPRPRRPRRHRSRPRDRRDRRHPHDGRTTSSSSIASTPDELEAEAAAFGLRAEPPRRIPQTLEYVGSTVVMLRG